MDKLRYGIRHYICMTLDFKLSRVATDKSEQYLQEGQCRPGKLFFIFICLFFSGKERCYKEGGGGFHPRSQYN